MPDVSKKGDSVVSVGQGNKFVYNFKAGSCATMDMVSIFKNEKGVAALKSL